MREMLRGVRTRDRVTVIQTWNDHQLTTHSQAPDPRDSAGPAPMDMLLAGLAACAAGTFLSIVYKMRLPIEEVRVQVEAERAEDHPKVWARIHYSLEAVGDIPEDRAQRALELTEKECPASVMLEKAADLTSSVTVVAPEA
jgi:putative redox protein